MLKKSLILLSVFLLVLGVLSGCATKTQEPVNQPAQEVTTQAGEQSNKENQTTYPLTIQDATGKEITIEKEPTRIISLVPSLTETLFALGLDNKVIAVTKWDNYPTDVKERVEYVFEDGLNPNIEQIVSLNADLVVSSSLNDEITANISNLGIAVVKFDPKTLNQVYETIEKIGVITNSTEQAKVVIDQMQQKEKAVLDKVAKLTNEEKVKVWVEISTDLWTAGKGTFLDELITKAGGINIVDEEGWTQYSEEKIIAANPQVILTTYSYYVPNPSEQIIAREGWQGVEAVKNKQLIDLDSDRVNRPGPRIVDGLEEIAKALYPNLFK